MNDQPRDAPRILNLRRTPPDDPKRIAFFDAAITDDFRIYGLMLHEFEDGSRRTIAPQTVNGRHAATFTPALGRKLTDAASAALEGLDANDRRTRT